MIICFDDVEKINISEAINKKSLSDYQMGDTLTGVGDSLKRSQLESSLSDKFM